MKGQISIVIPAYNEAASIREVLEGMLPFVTQHQFNLLVVNDGSRDNTAQEVNKFIHEYPDCRCQLIQHKVNRGYGGAIKSGIRHCNTPYVITMDADGQHQTSDLPLMYNHLLEENADMCIGNRNFKGSSRSRNLFKRILVYFVQKSTGLDIQDLNSGMKLYRSSVAKSLIRYAPNGMPFSDAMVLLHHQFRYKITETDIHILDRTKGESTINYKTAIYTLMEVVNIIINFFPFRFFLYVAFLLIILSLAWGLPLVLAGKGLSTGTSFLLLVAMNLIFFGIVLENIVRSRFERHHYAEE